MELARLEVMTSEPLPVPSPHSLSGVWLSDYSISIPNPFAWMILLHPPNVSESVPFEYGLAFQVRFPSEPSTGPRHLPWKAMKPGWVQTLGFEVGRLKKGPKEAWHSVSPAPER